MYRTFWSSDGRTIFNARYFKSAISKAWCSCHWVRLPQMEMTRDRAKPPIKRRTYFEVGSKRWVTTFFRGVLSIAWSLSCTFFDVAFSSCFTWLMVSNKSLLRCSSLLASFLVRSVKIQIASLNLTNLSIASPSFTAIARIAFSSLLVSTLTETGVLSASVFFGEAESSSTFCSNLSTVP